MLEKEKVAGSSRVLTPHTGKPDDVIKAVSTTVRESLEEASATEHDLAAVGIGTPGEIDSDVGAVLLAANIPGFTERVELDPLVFKRLGVIEQMAPHLFVPDKPPAVLGTELKDLSGAVGAAVLVGG